MSTSMPQRVRRTFAALSWETRRTGRRLLAAQGWWGVGLLVAAIAVAVAWSGERRQASVLREVQRSLAEQALMPAAARAPDQPRGKVRMEQFEATLVSHEDLPTQVQDLLNLAEREHLSAARGEYRPQADAAGRFMRYRISLPVKGEAQAVHRFIESALREHPAMGLESVQFQRQRIDSAELEARIQWVVLARLPQGMEVDAGSAAGAQR